MKAMTTLTRRTLFQAACGLGLGSLFLPELGRAQDTTDDRKLIFIYAEAGWTHRAYRMRPPWAPAQWSEYELYAPEFFRKPDDLEWEFELTDPRLTENDFSRLLRPLYRHRDIMIATEGLAMLTTALDQYGDAHAQAHIHAWSAYPSGSEDGPKSRGAAPSLDQRIHEHIRLTDPGHQTMDFRLMAPELFHEWLYRSDGSGGAARLPTETDPRAAFDRFFGAVDRADPLEANAGLTLSMAMAEFQRLAPRLPREDQLKLEAHRDMLATLESKLGNRVACDSRLAPPDTSSLSRVERFDSDITSFAQMIAAGLSCGVSRVATLGSITPYPESYGLDASTDIHHEYEHPTDPRPAYDGSADQAYFEKEEFMIQRNVLQMESLARLLDVFRATPDGTGNLLDNAIVVYLGELSHGNHGHEYYPSLVFGSGGGMVTPGRYVKYAQNNPNPWGRNYHNEFTGTAHSKLLVSIAQGFGLSMDDFGVPTVPGEAPHVGAKGEVELGGPLHRLKI